MALKATPKKKKPSITKLKAKLDALFSQYIRLIHADANGNCTCYTCGKVMPWKEIQNGHLFSRGRMATRYAPENCRPQCFGCNCMQKGNYQEYFPRILAEIGPEALRKLEEQSRQTVKFNTVWYENMIEYYKQELKRYVSM
jgi:hypothetical protein